MTQTRGPSRPVRLAWDTAYADGGVPTWDTGRPQSAVVALIAQGELGGRLVDAGCGTGTHAVLLAKAGLDVAGFDVAASAIERARSRAREAGVDVAFVVADALDPDSLAAALGAPFDRALDVGLFHVFRPDERDAYARSLAGLVRPGGRAVVVAWSDRNPFGYGPSRIRRRDLRHAFRAPNGWRVRSIEATVLESRLAPGQVHAWLARLERR
jgi:SAM-dependent methyltransferase